MAAGAPRDPVYPIDIEAAVASSRPSATTSRWGERRHVLQMRSPARHRPACENTAGPRAGAESEARLPGPVEEGPALPGCGVVPKKTRLQLVFDPGGDSQPKRQRSDAPARLGPSNPLHRAKPDNLRPIDRPPHTCSSCIISSTWWAENYDKPRLKFQDRWRDVGREAALAAAGSISRCAVWSPRVHLAAANLFRGKVLKTIEPRLGCPETRPFAAPVPSPGQSR